MFHSLFDIIAISDYLAWEVRLKRAVSISIGSSKRDKAVVIDLLGEKVTIERIGTDGDMEKSGKTTHLKPGG